MLNSKVIKILHCVITLFLLIIVIFLIIKPEDFRDKSVLKRSQKINSSNWLYMTEYSAGGATVPIIYRYYLTSEVSGNDKQIVEKLNTLEPLIEGAGSVRSLNISDNGKVTFSWSGKVFSVSSKISKADFEIQSGL
ncbi:hypothetical protein [Pantoea sp.]|uniref:hypothetical protein n=1 Tax=Pantoea sp. TaxID=69393 RepID=UPI0031D51923